ncbi:MAG TPA: zf-TFIIB domain-containing protein [Polyangiaceae bacterium]|nr:zf-TFIIB domain-containing protein [Polyangiaceae bacterium]
MPEPGARRTGYARPSPFSDPVRYLKCPACGEAMQRKNFRESSGIIVDVCPYHGVWFDRGERRLRDAGPTHYAGGLDGQLGASFDGLADIAMLLPNLYDDST